MRHWGSESVIRKRCINLFCWREESHDLIRCGSHKCLIDYSISLPRNICYSVDQNFEVPETIGCGEFQAPTPAFQLVINAEPSGKGAVGLVACGTRQKNGPDVLLDIQPIMALLAIARLEVIGARKLATMDFCMYYMFMQTVIWTLYAFSGMVFDGFQGFQGRIWQIRGRISRHPSEGIR